MTFVMAGAMERDPTVRAIYIRKRVWWKREGKGGAGGGGEEEEKKKKEIEMESRCIEVFETTCSWQVSPSD